MTPNPSYPVGSEVALRDRLGVSELVPGFGLRFRKQVQGADTPPPRARTCTCSQATTLSEIVVSEILVSSFWKLPTRDKVRFADLSIYFRGTSFNIARYNYILLPDISTRSLSKSPEKPTV